MPPIDERLTRLEQIVKNIEMIVHGPPPIEERNRAYTDGRLAHKERNLQQDDQDIRHEMEIDRERNDKRHESNDHRFQKLEKLAYIGIGIALVFNSLDLIHKLLTH